MWNWIDGYIMIVILALLAATVSVRYL